MAAPGRAMPVRRRRAWAARCRHRSVPWLQCLLLLAAPHRPQPPQWPPPPWCL